MKWIDNWIKRRVQRSLNEWFVEREEDLQILERKISEVQEVLSAIRSQISELEAVKLKVPIEEYVLNSKRFRASLQEAHKLAHEIWPYPHLESFPSTITGIVGQNQSFESVINERFIVVIAGLKTRYVSEQDHEALYDMQIADRRTRPFRVDVETQQVIFLKPKIVSEEQFFSIRQNQGTGTLNFSVIGATISSHYTYGQREYELWGTGITCFICGRSIHSRDAIADAELLEKYTGLKSGVLCCSCFKVAKTIYEGKGGEIT